MGIEGGGYKLMQTWQCTNNRSVAMSTSWNILSCRWYPGVQQTPRVINTRFGVFSSLLLANVTYFLQVYITGTDAPVLEEQLRRVLMNDVHKQTKQIILNSSTNFSEHIAWFDNLIVFSIFVFIHLFKLLRSAKRVKPYFTPKHQFLSK